jgi:hypothetical protein
MNYKEFYQHLGNLLYSVSGIDGSIRPEEINKVKQLITRELLTLEDSVDEFGTDAAFLAEFQFDYCLENNVNPKESYDQFVHFFRENKNAISEGLRNMIFRITAAVAASFNGFNKKELIFLEDLKKDLSFEKLEKES